MKKIAILTAIVFLFALAMPCFAAECSVEAAFEKDEYKVGDTANITITYDTPHDGGTDTIYIKISTKGLKDVKLVSADTLICDDVTCYMSHDTDILDFTGSRLTIKEGYSGSMKLTAEVENVKQAEFSAKIEHEGAKVSAKATAKVADYEAPAPKPTAKPTEKPANTTKPDNSGNDKPTADKPNDNQGSTTMPTTGAASSAALGIVMCALGALSLVTLKRKEK